MLLTEMWNNFNSGILFWRVNHRIWMYSVWNNGETPKCYFSLNKLINGCFSKDQMIELDCLRENCDFSALNFIYPNITKYICVTLKESYSRQTIQETVVS